MKKSLFRIIEFVGLPFTILSSVWMKILVVGKPKNSFWAQRIFNTFSFMPINDQYYQPLVMPEKHLTQPLNKERNLPGIDLNLSKQLNLVEKFNYKSELLEIPFENKAGKAGYYYFNNHSFASGDAEILYNMVRFYKPGKIFEIGSGYSTLVVRKAIDKNLAENAQYTCDHQCIEPYEQPWLEETGAKVIREKVENVKLEKFSELEENDILFIDSSHIIRPQGDVLFEFLEILPTLKPGVIIHVHDIFTPRDYPSEWIFKERHLWNE
jgi:hypothetical protein